MTSTSPPRVIGHIDRVDVIVAVLAGLYVLAMVLWRHDGALDPWRAEGDWRQWLWTAWRASDPTLLPTTGDQFLADYLTAMHPPLYRLVFEGLAGFMLPAQAAVVLSVVAFLLTVTGTGLAVRRLLVDHAVEHALENGGRLATFGAATAVVLMARDEAFMAWSGGGYPRSFGPALVAWFLWAFVARRHRAALVILVVGAGVYPSPVVPCGLALGIVVVGRGVVDMVNGVVDVRRWWRELVELFVGAAGIAVLALWQNRVAPAWWGKVVRAGDMNPDITVALTDVGRCTWWPHAPVVTSLLEPLAEPWRVFGHAVLPSKTGLQVVVGVVVVFAVVVLARRAPRLLPGRVVVFLVAVVLAWLAARTFAFQLYFPKRMLQHPLPVVSVVFVVVVVGRALAVLRLRPAALVLLLVPVLWFGGDGFGTTTMWRDRSALKPLMTWVQTTPKDARFAGDLALLDWIPFYGPRHAWVNFTLAHPFRAGFFAEAQRRILAVHDAIYADDATAALAFLEGEGVDYLVVDKRSLTRLPSGFGQLFEPMRSVVDETMFSPRRGRFVWAAPPAGAVVFEEGDVLVVGRDALRASLGGPIGARRPNRD